MEPKIESSPVEHEIREISKEVSEQNFSEQGREAIKRVVGEKLYPQGALPPSQSAPAREPAASPKKGSLPSYADALPPPAKEQAERLLSLAFSKGIFKAIDEVRKSDPLTMDMFHDAITDRLYSEFQRRGLMK